MTKKQALTPQEDDSPEVLCLIRAHEIMNHKGAHWIKGHFFKKVLKPGWKKPERCYCLAGGVNAATTNLTLRRKTKRLLVQTIHQLYRGQFYSHTFQTIYSFNDTAGTTWRDVERVIVTTIKNERKKK